MAPEATLMLAGNKLPTIGSIQLPALCHGGFARMPPARIAAQLKMAYECWVLEKHPSLNLAWATIHIRALRACHPISCPLGPLIMRQNRRIMLAPLQNHPNVPKK